MMARIFISLFFIFGAVTAAKAEPITFEATVNASRITLDEVLQLTLTVTGVNGNLNPISLPVLDGFSAKYLGPSTSVSIVNGDYHSERSFIYDLFPNKAGHFQIPPISATIESQTYTTKPIDVEVLASSPAPQAPNQPVQNQVPNAESLQNKIMIMVAVDNTDVYLNQRLPLTVKLLVNDVPMRDIQYPQFDKTGISVDDFEKPETTSEVINGVRYDVVIFKTNIYPNRLGDITLGPVQIQGNVLYKTGQNNPLGQDNDFMGVTVFNNFFDSYAARPVTVTSRPIVLHVSPLPQEGRPDDFSGALGSFEFQAAVSPAQVKVGDPLTLKMTVAGSGNFKNMKMPVFQGTQFKAYEPQIKDTGKEKKAEQVIIPTSAEVKEVPALRFSYFDTTAKEYKTIVQGPFPVTVSPASPDQEFKAVGFSDVSKEVPPVEQPFFNKMLSRLSGLLMHLLRSLVFWAALAVAAGLAISYLFWRRFQQRLENDPAFARRLKAVREARQLLSQAQGHIPSANAKEFYALLSKALRDYLANKWHEPSASLTVDEILSRLKDAQLNEDRTAIKAIFEQADLVCFAGISRDPSEMRADLSKAQALIVHLEKILK